MTEDEWLACNDPRKMLLFLERESRREGATTPRQGEWRLEHPCQSRDRKFRLFACACCRRAWTHIPEDRNRDAVVAVEEFLEGKLSGSELESALGASSAVEYRVDGPGQRFEWGYWIVKNLGRGFYKFAAGGSALVVATQRRSMTKDQHAREGQEAPATVAEDVAQSSQLRCIFGDRGRLPEPLSPAILTWNDGTVVKIAQGIYEDRQMPEGTLDTGRLAILHDALLDAGCNDEELLTHCRNPEDPVRGCWALDLLLGKS
jgi:hypothetical protein